MFKKRRTLLIDLQKAGSISLLIIFLFNIVGYKVCFFYLEQQADIRLSEKIQTISDFDSRLIEIKIPINLPYQTDWREFESIDGEMTFKGETYKYVKRKVLRDTLILLCIDHSEKSKIQKSKAEYFSQLHDFNTDTSKKQVLKQSKDDFFQRSLSFSADIYPVNIETARAVLNLLETSSYHPFIENPPDQLA